jgi:hypothetical protein
MGLADICARQRCLGCIFCGIASDTSNPRVIYCDDAVVAFDDIDPAAAAHILVRSHEYPLVDQFGALNLYFRSFLVGTYAMFRLWMMKNCVSKAIEPMMLACADMLPVARMVAVGESLLAQRGFRGNCAKMGFHVPPFISVGHLHLHCLSLPLNNLWRDIK